MAVNNAIAGAAVVVTANADPLVRGLEQSKKRVEKFGRETKDVWDKIGDKFGGGGGGFIAKALGAGFFGGLAGSLAIRTFDFLREGISDVVTGKSKWTQELGRLNLQYQLLDKNISRALATRDEWRDAGTTAERGRGLTNDILDAERSLEVEKAKADAIRDRLELLNSFGVTNTAATLFGSREKDKAFLEADLGRAEAGVLKFAERLGDLREAKKRLDPAFDPAVKASINSFIGDLDKKMRTMGMTAEESALALLKLRGGPADMLGDAARKLDEFKASAKENELKELAKDAGEFAKELEQVADALAKNAASAERLKANDLFGKGLRGEEMDRVFANVDRLEKARKSKELQDFNKAFDRDRLSINASASEQELLEAAMNGLSTDDLWRSGAFRRAAQLNLAEQGLNTGPKFAAAIEQGTQEAYSLELRQMARGMEGPDKSKDPVEVAKEANRILRKIEDLLKRNAAGSF